MRAALAGALLAGLGLPAWADSSLDALVAAYPSIIVGYDAEALILTSGRRIAISDGIAGKSAEARLDAADIDDMFAEPYPLGPASAPPAGDPGRARNPALFDAIYGDCRKGEVERHLRTIRWLPGAGQGTVRVTTVNEVATRLEAVGRDLAMLPVQYRAYLTPSAGTYHCRAVAGTSRMSMHAYGAAIDINVGFADYWRWRGAKSETDPVSYRNRIPAEIVSVFERHGFIWGGKWHHFDTMHFEYRPEIIATGRRP